MRHSGSVRSLWWLCLAALLLAIAPGAARAQLLGSGRNPLLDLLPTPSGSFGQQVHFVPNTFVFWNSPLFATTDLPVGCTGSECMPIPAYADVLLENSNFIQCKGGPYALCYYSGPNAAANLSCELTLDGKFANCNCCEIPYGTYFVDLNSILNYFVYLQTVAVCGADGSQCSGKPNRAPVCTYINNNNLIPGADMVSTFSFDCIPTNGIGSTNCAQAEPYAGCMTAPCYRNRDTDKTGLVQCSCPIYDGPYQLGLDEQQCTLSNDLVWSAAYNPSLTGTAPTTTGCYPDAPGPAGCPLLPQLIPPPPAGVNCKKVCEEYRTCRNAKGIEAGYTCDSTLCTAQCDDRDLSQTACNGLTADGHVLGACDISEIAKTEEAAGCSCCASQLCDCNANKQTNDAIYDLVQSQQKRGITSQCDQNGTLCGTPH